MSKDPKHYSQEDQLLAASLVEALPLPALKKALSYIATPGTKRNNALLDAAHEAVYIYGIEKEGPKDFYCQLLSFLKALTCGGLAPFEKKYLEALRRAHRT